MTVDTNSHRILQIAIMTLVMLSSFLLAVLFMPTTGMAEKVSIRPSPALRTIFQQLDKTYLTPMGKNFQDTIKQEPDVFASLLGVVMQRQRNYLSQNLQYIDQFEALTQEAISVLHMMAKGNDNRNPKDGQELSGTALEYFFYKGMNGGDNDWFKKNLNIDPTNVGLPMMLNQVAVKQEPTPERGALQVKKESDSISLLGRDAPLVEDFGRPSNKVFPENVLAGTWLDEQPLYDSDVPIVFKQKGNGFVGVRVYNRKFSQKTVKYTTIMTTYETGQGRSMGMFPTRWYKFKYKHICEPYLNAWECSEKAGGEDTLIIWWDDKKKRYYVPGLTSGPLGGYYKR